MGNTNADKNAALFTPGPVPEITTPPPAEAEKAGADAGAKAEAKAKAGEKTMAKKDDSTVVFQEEAHQLKSVAGEDHGTLTFHHVMKATGRPALLMNERDKETLLPLWVKQYGLKLGPEFDCEEHGEDHIGYEVLGQVQPAKKK